MSLLNNLYCTYYYVYLLLVNNIMNYKCKYRNTHGHMMYDIVSTISDNFLCNHIIPRTWSSPANIHVLTIMFTLTYNMHYIIIYE